MLNVIAFLANFPEGSSKYKTVRQLQKYIQQEKNNQKPSGNIHFFYQEQKCHDIEHTDDIDSYNPHDFEETAVTSLRPVHPVS